MQTEKSTPSSTPFSSKSSKRDVENIKKHLSEHQSYPATKQELVAACYELKDFSASDKQWFTDTLPWGTYNSASEVVRALGLN